MEHEVNTIDVAEAPFKERQRRLREEAILDAAEDILTHRGLRALSLDDVAARVGIAKGTIYLHFASKDALLAVLVARGIGKIAALIDGLDRTEPVLQRLQTVMRQLLRRHIASIQGLSDDMQDLKRIMAADQRCTELVQNLRTHLLALVAEGQGAGEIDPALPAPAIVGALFALLSPRSHLRMLADGSITSEDLNDALIRLFMRGIAADPARCPTRQGDET